MVTNIFSFVVAWESTNKTDRFPDQSEERAAGRKSVFITLLSFFYALMLDHFSDDHF